MQNKVLKLAECLKISKEKAFELASEADGGTCNFDSPYLILKNWRIKDVEEACEFAGVRCYKESAGVFMITQCTSGQGNRRTDMAEAFAKSMKDFGYECHVYYQID